MAGSNILIYVYTNNTLTMAHITTPVIKTKAKHYRDAYLTLMNDQVHFDCSNGEYGSITVSLSQLEEAILIHKNKLKNENQTVTQPRCN